MAECVTLILLHTLPCNINIISQLCPALRFHFAERLEVLCVNLQERSLEASQVRLAYLPDLVASDLKDLALMDSEI